MDHTVHGILQARILEWVSFPFSRGSSQPRDRTQVSHIVGGFFIAEPQGKPKNTGVGSLSLFQRIFLTQKLNRGLLHCRRILHQLSSQGSPDNGYGVKKSPFCGEKTLYRCCGRSCLNSLCCLTSRFIWHQLLPWMRK